MRFSEQVDVLIGLEDPLHMGHCYLLMSWTVFCWAGIQKRTSRRKSSKQTLRKRSPDFHLVDWLLRCRIRPCLSQP